MAVAFFSRRKGGEMAKAILIEEFHLTVYVPCSLTEAESRAIRRTLDGASFRCQLQRAVQDVFGAYRSLARATVRLSR
jgi:hypothetical protein